MILSSHFFNLSLVFRLEVKLEVVKVPEVAGGLLALGGCMNQPVLGCTAANLAP